ncbi:transketolase C-terminal domain-containing protein [Clostridium sp. ZS2-4]|uniref:transketolase C-terminal domain-containing protein n=1 Tax=Clostridium sp. ZS2-4 TaxID=2987703 RepID=UPI002DD62798|nr:transketolase C-terminal domain-containing protein [Clostridium sp. ZS2-4]
MVLNRKIFNYFPKDDCAFEEVPLKNLSKANELAVYEHKGFWTAIDTFKDVKRVDKLWEFGKAINLIDGKDITIITTGNMLEEGIEIANKLMEKQISVNLVSIHTIKPLDEENIKIWISNKFRFIS